MKPEPVRAAWADSKTQREQYNALDEDWKELDAENAALREQLAEETKRADDNFTAYDRIKTKYSETINRLAQVEKERDKFSELADKRHDELCEARAAAFREGAQIARMMAAGETYETGRQKALNIAAALEATANSAPKDTEP